MLQKIKMIKLKLSTQTTQPLMMAKSMVESTWAEDMGQFLCYLDPDTRKITRRLEKLHLKIINSVPSSSIKLVIIYVCVCVCVSKRKIQ